VFGRWRRALLQTIQGPVSIRQPDQLGHLKCSRLWICPALHFLKPLYLYALGVLMVPSGVGFEYENVSQVAVASMQKGHTRNSIFGTYS